MITAYDVCEYARKHDWTCQFDSENNGYILKKADFLIGLDAYGSNIASALNYIAFADATKADVIRRIIQSKKRQKKNFLNITEWHTKTQKYANEIVGNAAITHDEIDNGIFLMEGINGYLFYNVKRQITQTTLRINGVEWMNDNPLQYIGMQELAKRACGNVLVAGLGLGIIAHFLLQNKDVKHIDIIERDADVLRLVGKYLDVNGNRGRLRIINQDFYDYVYSNAREKYNTVIVDIWAGKGSKKIAAEMGMTIALVKEFYNPPNIFVWGINDARYNPAINEECLNELRKVKDNL